MHSVNVHILYCSPSIDLMFLRFKLSLVYKCTMYLIVSVGEPEEDFSRKGKYVK